MSLRSLFPEVEIRRVRHAGGGKSRTRQSDTAATDMNKIVAKYHESGIMPPLPGREPRYGDFGSGISFHEALNAVRSAEAEFENLPVAVRRHVKNDPGEFLDMVYDPSRRGELEELGLVETQAPTAAPPAAEPAAQPAEAGAEAPVGDPPTDQSS